MHKLYGDIIGLVALLSITTKDGTKQSIKTYLTWHAIANGPTVSAELYHGEVYDSRFEIDGLSEPSFDDGEWLGAWLSAKRLPSPKGMLTPSDGPPKEGYRPSDPKGSSNLPAARLLLTSVRT